MQPVMRPIWRSSPATLAIDAVASLRGQLPVGLLITNRVYLEGKYTAREAAIIATGFSTVSAAFMIIVAKTLNLMGAWNFYFWSTLVIAFAVTAITAWLPPISRMDHTGGVSVSAHRPQPLANRVRRHVRPESAPCSGALTENLRDGIAMASAVVPPPFAVGLIGLLLARYTPVFDLLGLLLVPSCDRRPGRAHADRQGAGLGPGRDVPARHSAQGRRPGAPCGRRGLGQLGAVLLGVHPLRAQPRASRCRCARWSPSGSCAPSLSIPLRRRPLARPG
ncbi:MAG: hypothetical protein R3E42_03765 [Burkholderiaceae bacterium]